VQDPPADVPKADITPIQEQNKDVEVAVEMGTRVTEVPDKEQTDQVSNEGTLVTGATVADMMTKKPFTDSTFEFEGYAPGKSHIGTFEDIEGYMLYKDGELIGYEGTIQAASVSTSIGKLTKHLKTDDFFDVEKYPEIKTVSTKIDKEKGEITGELTFHGVTNVVTFPATITDNSVTTDFLLDTTPFNMKYPAVSREVRIAFTFKAE